MAKAGWEFSSRKSKVFLGRFVGVSQDLRRNEGVSDGQRVDIPALYNADATDAEVEVGKEMRACSARKWK